MFRFIAACAVALACLSPAMAQDKRVALVIGNASYATGAPVKTALNDAADVGAALGRIGFAVMLVTDAPRVTMDRTLGAFRDKAKSADIAVVFYAGHAIQREGVNWLVPVDGWRDTLADTTASAVHLDRLVDAMAGVRQFGVVLLDAPRDNPFPEPKQKAKAAHSATGGEPKEMLVGFATGPGRAPVDVGERNSAFTKALLKHIETPDLELTRLMRLVRDEVFALTGKKQAPFTYATLTGDRYLTPR